MKKKILITTSSFGVTDSQPLDTLYAAGLDVTLNPYKRKLSEQEALELYKGYDYVIAGTEPVTSNVIQAATELRFLSRMGAGTDNLDKAALKERNIPWDYVPDSHVPAVAELTLAGMLNGLRKLVLSHESIRNNGWEKPMGSLLQGKTVGLIGLGRVARHLVQLLQPFGVQVLAFEKYPDRDWMEMNKVTSVPLQNLLESSDIISLHVPYAEETHHLISKVQLHQMKVNAILINTARGGLIDEEALHQYLTTHTGACAMLDVFEQEPYTGPLRELPNVILTAHIGGYAQECRVIMEQTCANQIVAFHQKNG